MVKEKEKTKQKPAKAGAEKVTAGAIASRGRTFEGAVIRKFHKRITIEFERTLYLRKYERFMKKKTRIHARLPEEMYDDINVGDFVKVRECRPLSKTIHFIFMEKISSGEKNGKE